MPLAAGTYAVFTTTEGKITVRLFESDAPITVKNFIELAEGSKEWTHPTTQKSPLTSSSTAPSSTASFRLHDPGRRPTGTGMGGPGYRFQDETKGSPHKFDKPGKLAMANSGPGTNGCQFFITVAPTPHLTGNHTIFGEVVEGQEIATKSHWFHAAARTSPRRLWCWNPSSSSASVEVLSRLLNLGKPQPLPPGLPILTTLGAPPGPDFGPGSHRPYA